LTTLDESAHLGSVPIGSATIYLVLASLAFAEGPSRGTRRWRRIAFIALGGLVLSVILQNGIDTESLFNDPPLIDLVAVLAAMVIAIDLLGLPLPVARRLRLGLHSREWEFDRRLAALNNDARRAVQDAASDIGRQERELPPIIARIAALRAPDEDWAAVRDGWASAWQRWLDLLGEPRGAAAWEEALAHQDHLIERTELLRVRYRSDASRILGKGS
jgi:hypothetical protein